MIKINELGLQSTNYMQKTSKKILAELDSCSSRLVPRQSPFFGMLGGDQGLSNLLALRLCAKNSKKLNKAIVL